VAVVAAVYPKNIRRLAILLLLDFHAIVFHAIDDGRWFAVANAVQ
jgi:hypothetical protein